MVSDDLFVEEYSSKLLGDILRYYHNSIYNLVSAKNIFVTPRNYSFENIKENSINFYNKYFKLHDVYYVKNLPRLFFGNLYSNYLVNKIYNNEIKINPFDVPIIFNKSKNDYYIYAYNRITSSGQDINIVKNISLPSMDNVGIMNSAYIHEICHTQYPSKGFCSNANYNDELLSIFMEFLHSDGSINNKVFLFRLNNFFNIIPRIDNYNPEYGYGYKKEMIKYVESTLKAFMLYYLYSTEFNTSQKATLIDDIQLIFDNIITTEDLLNKYDINEEDYRSDKFIKHFVK